MEAWQRVSGSVANHVRNAGQKCSTVWANAGQTLTRARLGASAP